MAKTTKKKEKDEKLSLQEAINEIKERFGEGSIMKLKDIRPVDVEAIPTGSISLDLALGVGGIPRGRVVEIFGPESSGKSTLALHILSEAQRRGGVGAFVDAEHALDPDYAKRIGVDIGSGTVDIIVIDSVAALTPKAEIAGEMGDMHLGLQARLLSQACRKLSGVVSKTNTAVVFINQTRMKIASYGNPETTPGGLALKFYSSVRIRLSRIAQIKYKDEIIGSRIKAKIVKNKVAAPFKIAEFDIYYNEGISKAGDIIRTGIECKVIKRAGSWFQYNDQKLGQGMEASKKFLKENPKVAKQIKKETIKAGLE